MIAEINQEIEDIGHAADLREDTRVVSQEPRITKSTSPGLEEELPSMT